MADYPELLILRHGETEWNRQGRMQGQLDSPLTATGRSQAQMQNTLIATCSADAHAWFTSPQGRAMETARIASRGFPAELRPDTRLREIEMGDWTGQHRDEIRKAVPHLFANANSLAWYGHAPGGETLEDLAARARAFLDDLTGPAVIVTHGITSRMLRCVALGLPISAFADLQGGQGVLYRVSGGRYERVHADGTEPQDRPV